MWQTDSNIIFDEPLKNSLWKIIVKQDHNLIVEFASKWFDVEVCNEMNLLSVTHIKKEKERLEALKNMFNFLRMD